MFWFLWRTREKRSNTRQRQKCRGRLACHAERVYAANVPIGSVLVMCVPWLELVNVFLFARDCGEGRNLHGFGVRMAWERTLGVLGIRQKAVWVMPKAVAFDATSTHLIYSQVLVS